PELVPGEDRPRRAGAVVDRRSEDRDGHADVHHQLEVHRLRRDPHARRAPVDPGGALRGRLHRRRELLADAVAHHAAASRPDDPHLGVPIDHRIPPALRPRQHHLGPVRGRDCRNVDDGHIHVSERPPRGQLRLRQRRRGRAVPHRARRRTRLPALRVEPRHGGCPHGRRRKEEAMTTTATAIRAVRRRRGTTHTAGPWVYLMATILVAICIGPVLYIIIGGFRTNSQITQDPSGWPAPWVFSNYGDVLVSSEFWLAMGNSTI